MSRRRWCCNGVGARLDAFQPELLSLRAVNEKDMIAGLIRLPLLEEKNHHIRENFAGQGWVCGCSV